MYVDIYLGSLYAWQGACKHRRICTILVQESDDVLYRNLMRTTVQFVQVEEWLQQMVHQNQLVRRQSRRPRLKKALAGYSTSVQSRSLPVYKESLTRRYNFPITIAHLEVCNQNIGRPRVR